MTPVVALMDSPIGSPVAVQLIATVASGVSKVTPINSPSSAYMFGSPVVSMRVR